MLKANQALLGDHDLSALDRYWPKDYIQHNSTMGDGTKAVRQSIENPGADREASGYVFRGQVTGLHRSG